jgi:hypothetical protein
MSLNLLLCKSSSSRIWFALPLQYGRLCNNAPVQLQLFASSAYGTPFGHYIPVLTGLWTLSDVIGLHEFVMQNVCFHGKRKSNHSILCFFNRVFGYSSVKGDRIAEKREVGRGRVGSFSLQSLFLPRCLFSATYPMSLLRLSCCFWKSETWPQKGDDVLTLCKYLLYYYKVMTGLIVVLSSSKCCCLDICVINLLEMNLTLRTL